MAQRISAPEESIPTFFSSEHSGRPHVEVDSQGYHLVVLERGDEISRKSSTSMRDLLYWIFSSTTFLMAWEWELENRDEKEDFRRKLFSRQIELMKLIDPEFGARREVEIESILKKSPYASNGA